LHQKSNKPIRLITGPIAITGIGGMADDGRTMFPRSFQSDLWREKRREARECSGSAEIRERRGEEVDAGR